MSYQRRKLTIPAAGALLQVPAVSRSYGVIVESIPTYKTPDDVPLLRIGTQNNPGQPLYPQSTYTAVEGGEFDTVYLEGTSESAGDTVYLLFSDDCQIRAEININTADLLQSYPGPSFAKTSTDTAQTLSPVDYLLNDQYPRALLISCATNPARLAFGGAVPTTAGFGHLLAVGDFLRLEGLEYITTLRYISATAGNAAALTLTLEY